MSTTFKNFLMLILAVLALVAGFRAAEMLRAPETAVTPLTYGGGAMINFTLPDQDGKRRSIEEWRGKVIVLNFWATWCPPCREEIPLLINLQNKYGAEGVQVIGIAVDDKMPVVVFLQSSGINYPILMGDDSTLQLIARYGNSSGSLPFSVVIDRSGAIAVRKLGAFKDIELESLIKPLIRPSKAVTSQNSY